MIYFSEKDEIGKDSHQSRLERFRRLKEQLAVITKKPETTQEEFDNYIQQLSGSCRYETGIHNIISLCNNNLFKCEYRSKDTFSFGSGRRFECRREQVIKLRSLL